MPPSTMVLAGAEAERRTPRALVGRQREISTPAAFRTLRSAARAAAAGSAAAGHPRTISQEVADRATSAACAQGRRLPPVTTVDRTSAAAALVRRIATTRTAASDTECDLLAPPLGLNHYQSTRILGGPHSSGAEGGGECTPEALDLTQSAVAASSMSGGNDEMTNLGTQPGAENAIDRDTSTYWEMEPGARDPAVLNSAWFQIDLR